MNDNKAYTICDGQFLDREITSRISNFLNENYSDLFIFSKGWKINFVGFLSINENDKTTQIYAFPKSYEISNLRTDFMEILKTIKMFNGKGLIKDVDGYNISNKLEYYESIIKYYNKYGLHFTKNKSKKTGSPKNINFHKTVAKSKYIFDDNNIIFIDYINNYRIKENTFLSKCMSYIINEGKEFFPFIDVIKQEILIFDTNEFNNIKYIIQKLHKIKHNTYKDIEKKLIDDLINYFEHPISLVGNSYYYLTRNYNLIWERMISSILDVSNIFNFPFFKEKKLISHEITNNSKKSKYIEIDHLNIEHKTIIDSKYYNYSESISFDYKQYTYHKIMTYYTLSRDLEKLKYTDYIHEIKTWKNILVRPCCGYNENTIKTQTIDDVEIITLFLDCKRIINSYLSNNPIYLDGKLKELF